MTQESLSQKEATELAGAFARLQELGGNKIITTESAAEKRALDKFLSEGMTRHANEFLGCWFAVRHEYEPLVGIVASIIRRATAINSPRAQQTATPEQISAQ